MKLSVKVNQLTSEEGIKLLVTNHNEKTAKILFYTFIELYPRGLRGAIAGSTATRNKFFAKLYKALYCSEAEQKNNLEKIEVDSSIEILFRKEGMRIQINYMKLLGEETVEDPQFVQSSVEDRGKDRHIVIFLKFVENKVVFKTEFHNSKCTKENYRNECNGQRQELINIKFIE